MSKHSELMCLFIVAFGCIAFGFMCGAVYVMRHISDFM